MQTGGGQLAVLNQVALVPKVSTLQLGFVPGRVQQRAKLLLRAIGGVCAQRGAKVEVGKRGEPRPEKGDAEVKVPDDPKLRLELKVKIDAIECNARKAKGGEGVGRLRGHTIGVDFGDAKTGLSVSRGGYAPRPLTVSSCSLAVRSDRNGSSSTRCSLLPSKSPTLCVKRSISSIRRSSGENMLKSGTQQNLWHSHSNRNSFLKNPIA